MTLLFDDSNHQYYEQLENGRRTIPSVTQMISPSWKPDPYYGEKGRKIHRAIQLLIKGTLDESKVSPIIVPYLEAFKDFMKQSGAKVIEYETMVYNGSPEYAGRFDAIMNIKNELWMIDFKSGGKAKWHKRQVALYGTAKWGKDYFKHRLMPLYLKDSGLYVVDPLTLKEQTESQAEALEAVRDYYKKQDDIFGEIA